MACAVSPSIDVIHAGLLLFGMGFVILALCMAINRSTRGLKR